MKTSSYNQVVSFAKKAKLASRKLALVPTTVRNAVLKKMAKAILSQKNYLVKENKKDLKAAEKKNYSKALIDRLVLDEKRIKAMAESLIDTAKLKDPTGVLLKTYKRPNGLIIDKVSVPIGVVGIIYESRPNVTSDCIGLCLKSGNSVILKGGKEAYYSNQAIFSVLKKSLKNTKIPEDCIQLIGSTDRRAVSYLLKQNSLVDIIVPRGGEGLIRFVAENSLIPVIKHFNGICHVYVSNKADLKMANKVCFNAKVQRPGVCNAMETMLVHKSIAKKFLTDIGKRFIDAGVELRGCTETRKIIKGIKRATKDDWSEEYLALILSIKVVRNTQEAIDHINTYSSGHSDAIITKDKNEARAFTYEVDSACLFVNTSTRFSDGYEFGFGAEVGISTDKLHVRGPMGLEGLTTYKYIVKGKGQIRK